mmetsp:Transcript_17901/g.44239  ORF Transcript_17901/g.44239 Transcript_17901/m.44239 type:complete len:127 (-) Transcript_17901:67-447(-)
MNSFFVSSFWKRHQFHYFVFGFVLLAVRAPSCLPYWINMIIMLSSLAQMRLANMRIFLQHNMSSWNKGGLKTSLELKNDEHPKSRTYCFKSKGDPRSFQRKLIGQAVCILCEEKEDGKGIPAGALH